MYTINNAYNGGQWGYQRPVTSNNQVIAMIKGGLDYPGITGMVTFQNIPGGTWVCANITGLPPYKPAVNRLIGTCLILY